MTKTPVVDDSTLMRRAAIDMLENDGGVHNIVLDIKISPDSDIKELKAVLVIESLKEAGEVIRTEPAEEEIDSTFKGSLKAFINGDAEKVTDVMNRISDIEYFEILPCEQAENEEGIVASSPEDADNTTTSLQKSEDPYFENDSGVHNIILDIKISPDSDIKELKAVLVIESLKEAGEVIRTEPAEEEIDSTFKGSLKAFINGDAEKVTDVMNRISDIEYFEIISCEQAENEEEITAPSSEEDLNITTSLQKSEDPDFGNDGGVHNIVLDLKLSPDSDIKELKAVLVIESLKEAGEVIRTEPAEEEIDSTFKGSLKAFINGDAEKVTDVMNRISDIEYFEIISCAQAENEEVITASSSEDDLNTTTSLQKSEDPDFENDGGVHNIILDIKISPDSDIKELKAVLVIESLKEAGEVIRTEPAEEEIDSTFKGSLKAFINGDAEKVTDVMNRISDIEYFEILPCEQAENESDMTASSPEDDLNITTSLQKSEDPDFGNDGGVHNIVLDLKLSPDSDIKELKAVLVIESLKEAGEVIRTEPAEEEIDSTFKGSLKAFINGDAEKVTDVMNRISDIEYFEILPCEQAENESDMTASSPEDDLNITTSLQKSEDPDFGNDGGVHNIVLDLKLSPDSDIKELKAVLVIESLKEAGEVIRTEPAEEEIDSTFKGSLKAFINGDAEKVTDVMNRISDIEYFEILPCEQAENEEEIQTENQYGMDDHVLEDISSNEVKIDLPPTVTIIKSLVIESGNETYAIPISNVVEALDINEQNFKLIHNQPLLYVREKLIPAINLKEFFDIEDNGKQLEKEVGIIVEKDENKVALIVDSIIDQQEIVVKPLASILSKIKEFIGVAILGDGKVVPILDVSVLIGGDIDD
ncbi:hypothetical protein HNV12_04480 [Methanococcoides sp. SA1]|nr:hypothetical protein [Methanococcoides sp. SA1]